MKPSLSGAYDSLLDELKTGDSNSLVFSSSLETKVGASHALAVALAVGQNKRALGFGVTELFGDEGISLDLGPYLESDGLPSLGELEELWDRI